MIDGDFLCQAEPSSGDDPFNQDLLFANLAAVAPVYRDGGLRLHGGCARGRGSLTIANDTPAPSRRTGLPGEVVIARVTAPESERKERIVHRDLDPAWQQWGHARTVELEARARRPVA